MTLRRKLVREILDAKFRFFAISMVVAIGVAVFLASSLSYRNLDTSYRHTYRELNFADFRVKARDIPPYLVEEVSRLDAVDMVTARVKSDQPVSLPGGKPLLGRVTGLPPERPIVDDLLIDEGRYFEPGEQNVCIAESHFAEFYGLAPGDTLFYSERGARLPLEIIAVASSPEYIVLAGERGDLSPILSAAAMAVLWVPIEDAQTMAGIPGAYNEVLCTVSGQGELEGALEATERILAPSGIKQVVTREEHLGNTLLEMDLQAFRSFALFFPVLFLGVACFSIYILLSRMVHSQRPFIGVMRAMGYYRRQILAHYLSFALVIGIAGALVGTVAGLLLSGAVTGIYADTIGIPLVMTEVYPPFLAAGVLLSLVFCAVAGIWPAMKSSRLDPARAMTGSLSRKTFRRPLAERVLPFIKALPLYLKMPFRNMFRNRRRTLFTITGLAFSVMVVLLFLAILNTADHALTVGFRRDNRFDMAAIFLGGSFGEIREHEIETITSVREAEPVEGEDCTVYWEDGTAQSVLMGVPIETEMKRFYTSDGERIHLRKNRALLNQSFRDNHGLGRGETIEVVTAYGSDTFTVGGFISEPLGNLIYVPIEDARDMLPGGTLGRSGYYIQVDPGTREGVRERIGEMAGLVTIIDIEEIKREVNQYMELLYAIVYMMLVFALVMAFTLTLNSITINVLEREREIATMRTIGTEPWKISLMTTVENTLYGLVAIGPGILMGVLAARYSLRLQESEFFTLNLVVFASSYVIVAVGIVVLLLLSQVPALRYVKGIELAESTKERLR